MTMTTIFGIQLSILLHKCSLFWGFNVTYTEQRIGWCICCRLGLAGMCITGAGVLDFVYNELSRGLHLGLGYEAGEKGMV